MRCTSHLAERACIAECAGCRGGLIWRLGQGAVWLVAAHARAVARGPSVPLLHVTGAVAPTRRRIAWVWSSSSCKRVPHAFSTALRLSPWHGAPLKRLACNMCLDTYDSLMYVSALS